MKKKTHLNRLQKALVNSTSFDQWLEAASEMDVIEGKEAWRDEPTSPHYDHNLISDHLLQMRNYRISQDLPSLRVLIEESLNRNLGDLSNPALYAYSRVGTKRLISSYLEEVERTFDWLCDTPMPQYGDATKLALVEAALRVYGRSALILSGGGALGLYHIGVVKALWEQSLLPDVLSGASMGAIIAGGVCVRGPDEVSALWETPEKIHRQAVKIQSMRQALRGESLLDPAQLKEHVDANLGEQTFIEAYRRSGRVLNIAVSPTRQSQSPRLLNWVTSPDVLISSAAVASCALPMLFPPSQLLRCLPDGRHAPYMESERWVDGSITGDVPIQELGRLHNVNHLIVSQTNPHVLPFAKIKSEGVMPATLDIATAAVRAQTRQTLNLARRRMGGNTAWLPAMEWAHALTHQTYTGDINILPAISARSLMRVMKNPTIEELRAYILNGERATWPKLEMIRDQTRLSRSMLRCISRLKRRMKKADA